MSYPLIEFGHVTKTYDSGKIPVLHDVSFAIAPQELVCLIGPSGCGKSTVLKIIAGLDTPDRGSVRVPKNVSMVFQNGALFPWLTAFDNVALGVRTAGISELSVKNTAEKYLDMVGLKEFLHKYPRELSGGQRQRVGLARALAVEPNVLLMDEPFSALDPKMTDELHHDLLRIWKHTSVTIVLVSHLIEEAVSLADRILLLKDGRVDGEFPITLRYPRREQTQEFSELVLKIRKKFFA